MVIAPVPPGISDPAAALEPARELVQGEKRGRQNETERGKLPGTGVIDGMETSMQNYLTPVEIAQLLKVDVTGIMPRIEDGRLGAIRIGSKRGAAA